MRSARPSCTARDDMEAEGYGAYLDQVHDIR
jgi:hypothetical protein